MFGVVAWLRGVRAMGPSLRVAERGDERGAVSGIGLRFDDDEINPGVARMKDYFHAVRGMRISNGDSGLELKKRMVPLINRCTRHLFLVVRRGRTVKLPTTPRIRTCLWSLLFSGNND